MGKYPAWDDYGDPQCERHGEIEPCSRCEDGDLSAMTFEELQVACEPYWRQDTPKMQATVLLAAIRSNIHNAETGVISVEKLVLRLSPLIDDLEELHQAAMPESWDGIARK